MQYKKRARVWTNSTNRVTLDVVNKTATSYDWWVFLKEFDGILVFNNYSYSNTTAKHQRDVRRKLRELNIEVNEWVSFVDSLDKFETLEQVFVAQDKQRENDKKDLLIQKERRNRLARERRAALRLAKLKPLG